MAEGVERSTLTELKRRSMVRFAATDLMALPNESVFDRAEMKEVRNEVLG